MELQANSPPPVEAVKEKKKKKSKELVELKKSQIKNLKKDKKKKSQEIDSNDNVDSIEGGEKEEETNFWMPPVGERWDFDDGKDRWESCQSADSNEDSHCNSGKITFWNTFMCVRVYYPSAGKTKNSFRLVRNKLTSTETAKL